MLTESDIPAIARAVVDEIEERGAAMQVLDQRVKEQAARIAELEADSRERLAIAEDFNGQRVAAGRRISELEREVEALRCGDLQRYFDNELPADRFEAFKEHIARCGRCDAGLHGLMQETVAIAGATATKNAIATRRRRKR